MSSQVLDSAALSMFCANVASMVSSGTQVEDALASLCIGAAASPFQEACIAVRDGVIDGRSLSEAMRQSRMFPQYAINIVEVGEESGALDETLVSLSRHYDEESRLVTEMRKNLRHPIVTFTMMALVIGVTTFLILPTFGRTYDELSRILVVDATGSMQLARTLGLATFVMATAFALSTLGIWLLSGTRHGFDSIMRCLEHVPLTASVMYQMSLARLSSIVATHLASGITGDEALLKASKVVDNSVIRKRVSETYDLMTNLRNPMGLGQALEASDLFEPLHARILNVGINAGQADETLMRFSEELYEDALMQMESIVAAVNPVLTALMTLLSMIAIAAIMLPLASILSAI